MKRLLFVAGLALTFAGCYNDKYDKLYPAPAVTTNDPCDTTNKTISYATTISGIMASDCATSGCHDAASQAGGYILSTYQGVYTAAITNNRLMGSILHQSGFVAMPQGGAQLSSCKIAQISKWINQGAPNN
jgi:hypothetical protein